MHTLVLYRLARRHGYIIKRDAFGYLAGRGRAFVTLGQTPERALAAFVALVSAVPRPVSYGVA